MGVKKILWQTTTFLFGVTEAMGTQQHIYSYKCLKRLLAFRQFGSAGEPISESMTSGDSGVTPSRPMI